MQIGDRPDLRSYSTVGPCTDGVYRIAVKRLASSRGGSAYLFGLEPGARMTVSAPRNHFELGLGRPDYLLVAGGIVMAWNIPNYMLTSYMPTFLKEDVTRTGGQGIDSTSSEITQIIILWVVVFIIPALGFLSDRIGRKPLMLTSAIATIVLAFPMIYLVTLGSVSLVGLSLAVMALLLILFSATSPSTLPALFPTEIRYGGLSISFNIFVSAFAGTTSLIMSALVLGTGWAYWPAVYLIFGGLAGLAAIVALRDPARKSLPGSNPAVSPPEEARELAASGGATRT